MPHRAIRSRPGAALCALAALSAPALGVTAGSLSTAGGSPSSGHRFDGQTFTVPAAEPILASFTFLVHNTTAASASPTLSLYAWDAGLGTPVGPAIDASLQSVPAGAQEFALVRTPGVALVPGAQYVYLLDWGAEITPGAYLRSDYYPGGGILLYTPPQPPDQFVTLYDAAFQATFSDVPAPGTAVALGLALGGLAVRRRR